MPSLSRKLYKFKHCVDFHSDLCAGISPKKTDQVPFSVFVPNRRFLEVHVGIERERETGAQL
jgi:hypothetical protein